MNKQIRPQNITWTISNCVHSRNAIKFPELIQQADVFGEAIAIVNGWGMHRIALVQMSEAFSLTRPGLREISCRDSRT